MKIRMIDANALKETIEFHPTSVSVCMSVAEAKGQTEFKNRCLDDIDNAPTIDAIPVAWIEKEYQRCVKYGDGVSAAYRWLITCWRKEQEAR